MYKAVIHITLRPSILDPQGKTTQHALGELGFTNVDKVRMGKHVELWIDADSTDAAEATAREACDKLLANPVMEDYTVEISQVDAAAV